MSPIITWTSKRFLRLAGGLDEYKGTVVVASHDRSLIEHVATKIISFEEDGIVVFDGPLEEYLAKKGNNLVSRMFMKRFSYEKFLFRCR